MGKNLATLSDKELIRIATRNGARVVSGGKHILIYDGKELVAVLSKGKRKDRVPGGSNKITAAKFRRRGWS